jgi:hypothetical protein
VQSQAKVKLTEAGGKTLVAGMMWWEDGKMMGKECRYKMNKFYGSNVQYGNYNVLYI